MDPNIEKSLIHVESLADLMDRKFQIPGTPVNVGLDSLIGFIPVVGDTIGLGISGYIVSHAAVLKVRKRTLARMVFNIGVDWLIGLVPLLGDIFDIGWKANVRNAALFRREVYRH